METTSETGQPRPDPPAQGPHSREHLALIALDALSNQVCIVDQAGNILAINQSWSALAGQGGAAAVRGAVGANYLAACAAAAETGIAPWCNGLAAVLRGDTDRFRLTFPCDTPAGPMWLAAEATRCSGPGPLRVLIAFEDVTAQRATEHVLRLTQFAVDRVHNGVLRFAPDGRILYANDAALRLWNWGREEILEKHLYELFSYLSKHGWARHWLLLHEKKALFREVEHLSREGRPMYLHVAEGHAKYEDVECGFVEIADITARRTTMAALRGRERHLRRAVKAAPFPLMIHADDGSVVELSDAWSAASGYGADEIDSTAAWADKLCGPAGNEDQRGIASRFWDGEYTVRCKDGGERVWLFGSSPLGPLADGRMSSMTMAVDVTERRRAENTVRELNETLERRVAERTHELNMLNKSLEAFSYSISHDLRAPLRAINGFAQVLRETMDDRLQDEERRQLGRIIANSVHMGELIDDILEFSRLNRVELSRRDVDVEKLARDIATELQLDYPGTECRIAPLPHAFGDRALLAQALHNLLANAFKYSSKREHPLVEVGIETGTDRERVYFVRDNGVGFDMAAAQRLFEPFNRLHRSEDFPGTGVGLAIVRNVVERHGGRVWAQAAPEAGATFYFSLPG